MTTVSTPDIHSAPTRAGTQPPARATDLVKTYGRGETAVRALDGASVAIPPAGSPP